MSLSAAREFPASVDVLVIGGGITGAAIAYDAARRGLHVALVEARDFGGATSAATGKLIHGGLRYLKNLEIGLVRESLAERSTLLRIAPHLVQPIGMVLPQPGVIEHVGLTAYDLLSIDRNRHQDPTQRIPAHRRLRRDELRERGLDALDAGILYYDAMMISPERLTLAFLAGAADAGASVAGYARVRSLLVSGSRVIGARIQDEITGSTHEVRAGIVVNAAGPWVHDLLRAEPATQVAAGPAPTVRSEGIYLVTRQLTETMVLTVSGHSHFSFAPWRGHTLIGPTETPYSGPVDQWRLTRGAIEDFLTRINAANVLGLSVAHDDVVAAYGGLRPLTETASEDTYRASRASELTDHARDGVEGIVTATGGKYTNSRAFAQKAGGVIARKLGRHLRASDTARVALPGGALGDLQADRAHVIARGRDVGLADDAADIVFRHYGSGSDAVLDIVREDPLAARRMTPDGEPAAVVIHAARHEQVQHLSDILLRRSGIGRLGDPGPETLRVASDLAARELGWDDSRREAELRDATVAVRLPVD